MNQTVAQELANQLGVPANQVMQFAETYLQQYAAMKADRAIFASVVFGVLLIASCIALARSLKAYRQDDDNMLACAVILVSIFMIVFSVILLLVCAWQALAWTRFPEARMIQTVMKAIC